MFLGLTLGMEVDMKEASAAPASVTVRARVFMGKGRTGSKEGAVIHLKAAPLEIAPIDSATRGRIWAEEASLA